MGKKQETRLVQLRLSKGGLESRGADIELRRIWKPFCLTLILILVGGALADRFLYESNIVVYVQIALVVVLFGILHMRFYRVSKRFWDGIKDKKEPIELEPLPSWWRNKKVVNNG